MTCTSKNVICEDFVSLVLSYRERLRLLWPTLKPDGLLNEGELTAFIAYAQAFPTSYLCLVDTYETLSCGQFIFISIIYLLFVLFQIGIPHFLAVALSLDSLGLRPIGIRLDSGDLAYLSQ